MTTLKCLPLFLLVLILFSTGATAQELRVLENTDLIIIFDPALQNTAEEIAKVYPEIRAVVEKTFGWDFSIRPSVLLMADTKRFHQMAPHPRTVAFAVPKKQMIVMDYSKMSGHPFSLETTLKHEMCHLLLHHHIKGELLPRWLNEGVSQWASDWIGDIIWDQKRSLLNKAALRGTFIPLDLLKLGFPADDEALQLAYEQSKGFVSHILSEYGRDGVLKVLGHMKQGESVESAFQLAFSKSLDRLEREWRQSLKKNTAWFIVLSAYLYEILFGLTALIAIYGFIRIIIKKRAYMDEDPEDRLPS